MPSAVRRSSAAVPGAPPVPRAPESNSRSARHSAPQAATSPATSPTTSSTLGPRRAATKPETDDHLVLAAAHDPIITIDAEGTIRSVSDSIADLLGWTPAELVGRNVNILMPEPDRSRHDGYLARYRETGIPSILGHPRTLDAQHRDGRRIPVELCVSRADRPGSAGPLFVGILHNARRGFDGRIAETLAERRLQELLDAQSAELQAAHLRLRMADRMASVGTLSAGLGHDMNNVLLPVRAHLNAIESLTRSRAAARHIDAVRRAVAYLQQLSDGLHFLALDPERENLDEVTRLDEWWRQAGAILLKAVPRHVKVETSMPASLPQLRVAPHRLTQAILNLVVNAGEAIPRTRDGRVRVWAEPTPDGDAVRLGVTDNGEGMSPEVRRRAFEIFFTTKPRGLGTGLGLALVRNVAERAGGSVNIESAPGAGTTVTMLIPANVPAPAAQAPGAGTKATISVDDARAADLIRHLLERAGAGVRMDGDPEGTGLWILAPRADRLARARTWSSADPGRRLILFGTPLEAGRDDWHSLRPAIIDRPGELESVRSALAKALALAQAPPSRAQPSSGLIAGSQPPAGTARATSPKRPSRRARP